MPWTPTTTDDRVAPLLELEPQTHDDLASALVGSRQIRVGPTPTQEQWQKIAGVVGPAVADGRPIPLVTMYGAAKCYGQFPGAPGPDLFDLMALKRIAALDATVRRHHRPGVLVTVVVEDVAEYLLTGNTCTAYFDGLAKLANAVGLAGTVRFMRESNLCQPPAVLNLALKNAVMLYMGHADQAGWRGPLDWTYHCARVATEHPGLSAVEQKKQAALYLGMCLARFTTGMLPKGHLKLAFNQLPPSAPADLRWGRLEYKVKPGKCSNRSCPPWCGFGLFRGHGDWSHVTIREARAAAYCRETADVSGVPVGFLTVPG